jgi:small nuclear ribonucleoprotein (snRNP)-like protein
MDKKLFINLQGGRKVSGTLRGYDLFLNLVIDDAQEETTPAQRHPIGTVVRRMILKFPPSVLVDIKSRSSAETALLRWRRWKRYSIVLADFVANHGAQSDHDVLVLEYSADSLHLPCATQRTFLCHSTNTKHEARFPRTFE